MRKSTLVALAHAPFLAASDLALLEGIGERGARRSLQARVAAGEAGSVIYPATGACLYHLTASGVAAVADIVKREPAELAGHYGLGQTALLRRLPALDRLLAGRVVLLQLAGALAHTGGALENWRAFPVRWPFTRGHPDALVLDGEAILRFADGTRCVVGYLWDGDPQVPEAALALRLDRLAGVQACPAYSVPYEARVPPVLLVTAGTERVPAGYRPGLLWTTVDALADAGPLAAWRSTAGPGGTGSQDLRVALDRLGLMRPRPTPGAHSRVAVTLSAPCRPDALVKRAARVRAAPSPRRAAQDRLILPLVLPPRAWPLLQCVGRHPLMHRLDLATAMDCDPTDTWELLRDLCHHGLCRASKPTEPRKNGRAWRYSLSTQGTTLLARAQALTPGAYRRIYGVLDNARRSGERGLAYAEKYLEHTDGITAAYLAFLAAARASGGTLWWRGEWACTREYRVVVRNGREKKHVLRPDAELHYTGPDGSFRAFLEVDRANESAPQLAGKVDQYDAYQADSGDSGFMVLFVTPGRDRGTGPLDRGRRLAHGLQTAPIDVRATTATELATQGPWAPIWRDTQEHLRALITAG